MWTLSNGLSFLRLLLSIPLWFALSNGNNLLALAIASLAVITDIGDGWLARRLNQVTEFGKVIDPLADKVIIGTAALVLLMQGKMPLWFAIAVLGRDILILIGGLIASRKTKIVIPSNYVGKATVILLSLTILLIIIDLREPAVYMMYISTAAMAYSLVNYSIGMNKKIKEANS